MRSFALLLALGVLTSAQETPSYADRDTKFVFQVSTTGATTPYKNYHLTKNEIDDPKIDNYLTALGQRQQFLIGTELRNRYVQEQPKFLNYSYDISQIWIQSTFDAKSIMSAQAQLLGLYPPYSSQNYLNEWQQQNAVPPLVETAYRDWEPYLTEWQEELGSKALLDNINTFPINMNSHADDLMLRANKENCAAYKEAFESQEGELLEEVKSFDRFFTRLEGMFQVQEIDVHEAHRMCQYLDWADLHNIELTVQYTSADLSECHRLSDVLAQHVQDVDRSLNYLVSAELLVYLRDHISTISGSLSYEDSLHFKKFQLPNLEQRRKDMLSATNADEQPVYVFLMTEEPNMYQFLQAVSNEAYKKEIDASLYSTTLFFNLMEKDGAMVVEGRFNDEPIVLGGCEDTICNLDNFVQFLQSQIHYHDVKAACANTSQTTVYQ